MATIGPLLGRILNRIETLANPHAAEALAASVGGTPKGTRVPVVLVLKRQKPKRTEDWRSYRKRIEGELNPVRQKLKHLMNVSVQPLISGNALAAELSPDQIRAVSGERKIQLLELDPLVDPTTMDDALRDIELATFQNRHPTLTGKGVRVAVLDSGVDTEHPYLSVAESAETCGESVEIPGRHGTHCAGSIASRDAIFSGVAPDVSILNIKVLRADGSGRHTFIVRGIDEALDRNADVISMSLGFNHLPAWSNNGHGWSCDDGRCPLCTAVDNAVTLDDALVVVAAGNEHERAEALRQWGYSNSFDTELCCPGQAREVLTVGALTKSTFLPASFSSRGPTAYGSDKPDLVAPGVNVWSTIPVPRNAKGNPVANPPRAELFGRESGTSMATPIVAGTAALLIQRALDAGQTWTPTKIRNELLTNCLQPMTLPRNMVGAGRLHLGQL